MDTSIATALAFGFLLGLRHALDPDHLVAVSTIVSEHKSIRRSSLVGTFWGIGHTVSLFAMGLVVLLLKTSIPESARPWMEMPVALMLVLLGASAIWRATRERGLRIHTHVHEHDGESPHKHVHLHDGQKHDHEHCAFRVGR